MCWITAPATASWHAAKRVATQLMYPLSHRILQEGHMWQLGLGTGYQREVFRENLSHVSCLPWPVQWRANSLAFLYCITWILLQLFGNSNPPVHRVRPLQSLSEEPWILDIALIYTVDMHILRNLYHLPDLENKPYFNRESQAEASGSSSLYQKSKSKIITLRESQRLVPPL